jgi:t-SNARE complex subunit (syntaxin)
MIDTAEDRGRSSALEQSVSCYTLLLATVVVVVAVVVASMVSGR